MIYALNTKNDEHEEEIESLKDAHEDEVRAQEISSSYPYKNVILHISHVGSQINTLGARLFLDLKLALFLKFL